MLVLSIDTAAATSVALVRFGAEGAAVLAEFNGTDTRSHAEELAPKIQHVIGSLNGAGDDGVDAVVTGTGPGPFTGLRVGIMAARSLAFAWNKPLYGVMSLNALAYDVSTQYPEVEDFIIVTDARRHEVYWARYGPSAGGTTLVEGPHVSSVDGVPQGLSVYGYGATLYPGSFRRVLTQKQGMPLFPKASSLASVALLEKEAGVLNSSTAPLYLRQSDAQVPQALSVIGQG